MTPDAGEAGSAKATAQYGAAIRSVIDTIERTQTASIEQAARRCATAIADGRVVHVFGSGHSRILVEELWPRYGSFPGFNPIVELSLTAYHQVTGANGLRQAIFLENTPGLGEVIAQNFPLSPADALVAISASGTTTVTVELAEAMASAGVTVIAITSVEHSRRSRPRAPSGKRLYEIADVVLDLCTPVGDAVVTVAGAHPPVGPASTIAGAFIVNLLKVRTFELLVACGVSPPVLAPAALVGDQLSAASFEDALAEHARRLAAIHNDRSGAAGDVGVEGPPPGR